MRGCTGVILRPMIRVEPKKGTRKTAMAVKRNARVRRDENSVRLRWVAGVFFAVILVGIGILSLFSSGAITAAGHKLVEVSAKAGFKLDTLLVEGRVYSDPAAVKAAVGIEQGAPLLSFDPDSARVAIEKLPWIKSALVTRRWPGTVYIELTERQPLALWQKDKDLSLIGMEGEIITREDLGRFADLMIITGEKAPEHAAGLISLLKAEPSIALRVEAASWTGERRWNLKTDRDVIIKLPEEDVGLALSRLAKIDREETILEKDITQIDLREGDRVVVRTGPGDVKTYQAGFENKGDI